MTSLVGAISRRTVQLGTFGDVYSTSISKIQSGSFGDVYRGIHVQTNQEIAMKLEKLTSKKPRLGYESRLCKLLSDGVGMPKVHWYGNATIGKEVYNVMVMDLLGSDLHELSKQSGKGKLSLKTVLMLADQMIHRIEYIHKRNIIHRDVKPENFVIGRAEKANQVYMIDLGLAKEHRDPHTKQHIPCRENTGVVGTSLFASLNAQMGIEQSFRDDLEALGYTLISLSGISLPWQRRQRCWEGTKKIKASTSVEKLCERVPAEFVTYMNYCRKLRYEDTPDYGYLRGLLKELFFRERYQYDLVFDWSVVNDHAENAIKKRRTCLFCETFKQFVAPLL